FAGLSAWRTRDAGVRAALGAGALGSKREDPRDGRAPSEARAPPPGIRGFGDSGIRAGAAGAVRGGGAGPVAPPSSRRRGAGGSAGGSRAPGYARIAPRAPKGAAAQARARGALEVARAPGAAGRACEQLRLCQVERGRARTPRAATGWRCPLGPALAEGAHLPRLLQAGRGACSGAGAGLRGRLPRSRRPLDPAALLMLLVDADRPEPVRSGARELALFLTPEPGAEAKEVEETIEGMLLRLEEFCSLTDMIRSDTSQILEENIPLLQAKVTEMRGIYARVDQLEAFVKMVGHHVSLLEAHVLQAERDHGAFSRALRRWLGSTGLPSFGNKLWAPAPVSAAPATWERHLPLMSTAPAAWECCTCRLRALHLPPGSGTCHL
uniref:Breast carcinoma amplified sequence 4 n=1 Tax=Canis lupus familiaris TaxID=9615 RepID=A0A8C0PRW3_CANLF